jgi:hypothetical protein
LGFVGGPGILDLLRNTSGDEGGGPCQLTPPHLPQPAVVFVAAISCLQ